MENNVYQSVNGTTVIVNGGNPLPGCPESWEQAREIEKGLNGGITKDDDEWQDKPRWSFDCGFKLDYDGDLLRVSSRFYPPKTHYGITWDGHVGVFLFGEKVLDKEFDCPSLEELKSQVEAFVNEISGKVKAAIAG